MFNDWILERLKEKKWSQADLAREAGLTTGAISNYINGRIPDEASLRKLAKAFKLPPDLVFEKAGILPSKKGLFSEEQREIIHLVGQVEDEKTLGLVISMLQTAIRQRDEEKKSKK